MKRLLQLPVMNQHRVMPVPFSVIVSWPHLIPGVDVGGPCAEGRLVARPGVLSSICHKAPAERQQPRLRLSCVRLGPACMHIPNRQRHERSETRWRKGEQDAENWQVLRTLRCRCTFGLQDAHVGAYQEDTPLRFLHRHTTSFKVVHVQTVPVPPPSDRMYTALMVMPWWLGQGLAS